MMLGVNLVVMINRKITRPKRLVIFYVILGLSSMLVNIGIRLSFGRTKLVLSGDTSTRPMCWAVKNSEAYTDLFYAVLYLLIDIGVIVYLSYVQPKDKMMSFGDSLEDLGQDLLVDDAQ